jgi:hypothetical protein
MTIERLKEYLERRPFEPFDIYLADGRSVHVDHPEFLMQSRTHRTVTVALPDDRMAVVDLLLVTSIESNTNGSRSGGGTQQ